jgi:hypothetical protein
MQVVVVSQDAALSDVERFFSGPPEPALHLRLDPGGVLFDAFRIEKLPASILTVHGRLVARFDGSRRWDTKEMRVLLERLTRTAVSPPDHRPTPPPR